MKLLSGNFYYRKQASKAPRWVRGQSPAGRALIDLLEGSPLGAGAVIDYRGRTLRGV